MKAVKVSLTLPEDLVREMRRPELASLEDVEGYVAAVRGGWFREEETGVPS